MNAPEIHEWEVDIGSGHDVVPSGSKPLPEPVLILIHDAIWLQRVKMSHMFDKKRTVTVTNDMPRIENTFKKLNIRLPMLPAVAQKYWDGR